MMSNNKILTVSYGTFSCTLEGFDDSFGTMKAIAEYFRDLAADDRYFGAEPPQPDADMLARIAQREVSRRVQAHEKDGQIVLSAIETPTVAPAPPTPQEQPKETVSLQQDAETRDVADITANTAPVAHDLARDQHDGHSSAPKTSDTENIVTAATIAASTVAAAVAARPADLAEPADDDQATTAAQGEVTPLATRDNNLAATTDAVEPTNENTFDLDALLDAEAPAESTLLEDENDIVPGQRDADVEAFFATAKNTTPSDEQDSPVAFPMESIAAKLERIRAVVAKNDTTELGYAEDQHADPKNRAQQSDLDDTVVELADADTDGRDGEELVAGVPDVPSEEVASSVEETATEQDVLDTATADDPAQGNPDDFDAADDDDVDAILARLANATFDDEILDADDTLAEDTVNLFEDSIPSTAVETDDTLEDDEAADTLEQGEAPRARVIKVKRADLEAALQRGDLEEYEDDDADEQTDMDATKAPLRLDDIAPSRSRHTSLSPEDQNELVRELAALEDHIEAEQEPLPATPETASVEEEAVVEPAVAPTPVILTPEAATDVSRLMAETDQQMDEEAGTTRREAFAHLRAAVASQEADKAMGTAVTTETNDDAYREDLAQVVRPRRPEGGAQRRPRPIEGRPAPLKLVAEQRIDVETPLSDSPVRPRRVSATPAPASAIASSESFADYAAEMGADTLPQLLEAAASYMSFVEGREQFSRPQLMTIVRESGAQEDFSREDGLRSFGQLLRAGKIAKIQGGRFTVSDDIGFQPNTQAG